jgi:single-strand DNA-binding protein
MNHVTLIGRLTSDPTTRSNEITQVTSLRLAVQRPRGRDGQDRGADFVDIAVFGRQAETCQQYLAKGRKVAIDGHLHHSEWESENGRRQRLEVIARQVEFLDTPATVSDRDDRSTEPVAVGVLSGDTEDQEDIPF